MIVLTALIVALVPAARPARADSGSFTVSPGQTQYVSFGTCGVNELVFWDVSVSTYSTVFTDWLQKPDGTRVALISDTWGALTDQAGEWQLGFSVASSGFWSATVDYQTQHTVSALQVTTPADGSYVNTQTIAVSGSIDQYASYVNLSTDNVHFVPADMHLTAWSGQLQLSPGTNTVYVQATYFWGSYWAVFPANPISVTLDTTPPTVTITGPVAGAHIRSDYADITWQSADDIGVIHTMIKIDGMNWQPVAGFEAKHVWFSSGHHVVQISAQDAAGNYAMASTSFDNDNRVFSFGGPLYGLPTVATIVAVILVSLLVALTVMKRRRAPAAPPPTQPPAAPPAPPPDTQ